MEPCTLKLAGLCVRLTNITLLPMIQATAIKKLSGGVLFPNLETERAQHTDAQRAAGNTHSCRGQNLAKVTNYHITFTPRSRRWLALVSPFINQRSSSTTLRHHVKRRCLLPHALGHTRKQLHSYHSTCFSDPLQKTRFVVKRGNVSSSENRICAPNFEITPTPAKVCTKFVCSGTPRGLDA